MLKALKPMFEERKANDENYTLPAVHIRIADLAVNLCLPTVRHRIAGHLLCRIAVVPVLHSGLRILVDRHHVVLGRT